jgi:hypothetical protein
MADSANAPQFKMGDYVERDGVLYCVLGVYDTDEGQVLTVGVRYDPNDPNVPGVDYFGVDENGEELWQARNRVAQFPATDEVHLVQDVDRYYAQVGIVPLTPEEQREVEGTLRKLGDELIKEIDSAH